MKTDIYNLIILDESGSMAGVTGQTIDGCNETIKTIRMAQAQHADTQNHYVSIYAFQSDSKLPSRYLVKEMPVDFVNYINKESYRPGGCTPLYDAVGYTLTGLKHKVDMAQLAIGSVTIITDGMENSSTVYTLDRVVKLIDALKEIGWNFNFIGADIDVKHSADMLHMDSYLKFDKQGQGTAQMFERQNRARSRFYARAEEIFNDTAICSASGTSLSDEARKKAYYKNLRKEAGNYFDGEDTPDGEQSKERK